MMMETGGMDPTGETSTGLKRMKLKKFHAHPYANSDTECEKMPGIQKTLMDPQVRMMVPLFQNCPIQAEDVTIRRPVLEAQVARTLQLEENLLAANLTAVD